MKCLTISLNFILILILAGCNSMQSKKNLAYYPNAGDLIYDFKDPAKLKFYGSEVAELFTKEIEESFNGVLKYNYISKPVDGYMPGFVRASPEKQVWGDTFWTRDGGTFLRELIQWGYLNHACLTANYLIDHVEKNKDGFYSFPEYFRASEKKSGDELDGTCSIIIALVDLWKALDNHHPLKQKIYEFLHEDSSPLRYLHSQLIENRLIAGEGEFGGGCSIPGKYCNVVQNYLCVLALNAGSQLEELNNEPETAALFMRDAEKLKENMLRFLQNKMDSTWFWCVEPDSFLPDTSILNHPINKGGSHILGINCMYSDVFGLEPLASSWEGIEVNENTFKKLYDIPLRKDQFEKYGIWTQFEIYREGLSSGPSYGDGYALQSMLLYDKMEMADKSLKWIVYSTYKPVPEYNLPRESPYYFYERSYSPDAVGKMKLEVGCGALNLVNVTEPLKVARLILGLNNTNKDKVEIVPRLPESITETVATNWPVFTKNGIVKADITCKKINGSYNVSFKVISGEKIDAVSVRIPSEKGFKWVTMNNVSEFIL